MVKQAVGFLASAAGIAVLALLLGVLVRLASDTRSGFSVPPPDRKAAPQADKVLREA